MSCASCFVIRLGVLPATFSSLLCVLRVVFRFVASPATFSSLVCVLRVVFLFFGSAPRLQLFERRACSHNEAMGKHLNSYTAGFKLKVVAYALEHGKRAAGRQFDVDEKCVRRWCDQKDALASTSKTKRVFHGKPCKYPELENELSTTSSKSAATVMPCQRTC